MLLLAPMTGLSSEINEPSERIYSLEGNLVLMCSCVLKIMTQSLTGKRSSLQRLLSQMFSAVSLYLNPFLNSLLVSSKARAIGSHQRDSVVLVHAENSPVGDEFDRRLAEATLLLYGFNLQPHAGHRLYVYANTLGATTERCAPSLIAAPLVRGSCRASARSAGAHSIQGRRQASVQLPACPVCLRQAASR